MNPTTPSASAAVAERAAQAVIRRNPLGAGGDHATLFEEHLTRHSDKFGETGGGDALPERPSRDAGADETTTASVAAPRFVVDSLAVLQLMRLHDGSPSGASRSGAGDAATQGRTPSELTQGGAFDASDGAAPDASISAIDPAGAFARASADVATVGVSPSATATAIGAPMRLTLVSLATHLPAAMTHALSLTQGDESPSSAAQTPESTEASDEESAARPDLESVATGDSVASSNESTGFDAGGLFAPTQGAVVGGAGGRAAKAAVVAAPAAPPPPPAQNNASKLLTFQLEPEALGSLTVRMQLTRTRVSVTIDVDTAAVHNHLSKSRDELAEALGASGHTVEGISIRVSPAPVPPDSHDDARQNDSRASQDQRNDGGSLGGNEGMANSRGGESSARGPARALRAKDERAEPGARGGGPAGVYI